MLVTLQLQLHYSLNLIDLIFAHLIAMMRLTFALAAGAGMLRVADAAIATGYIVDNKVCGHDKLLTRHHLQVTDLLLY